MPESRAYARIDRGAAVLGNAWLEREWTGFSGATVALIHKAAERDWTAGPSQECILTAAGRTFGLMDFSVADIEETGGPYGAGLLMRRAAPGIQMRTELTAYHDAPLLVRRTTLVNTGDEAVTVERIAEDCLSLASPRIELRYEAFARSSAQVRHDTDERAVALHAPGGGWLVGREGGAAYVLGDPEPLAFEVAARAPIALEPGAAIALPRILWIAYTGAPEAAAQKLLGEAIMLLRQQDAEAAARESEST